MTIIVFNRLSCDDLVLDACLSSLQNELVLVTSHSLFRHERAVITASCPGVVFHFRTFNDFLDDSLLAHIDACALSYVRDERVSPPRYADAYSHRMLELKNEAVLSAVRASYPNARMFVHGGLGIISSVWVKAGAKRMHADYLPRRNLWQLMSHLSARVMGYISPKVEYYSVITPLGKLLFLGKPKRVRFDSSLEFFPVRRTRRLSVDGYDGVAVSIHQYMPSIPSLGLPVYLLVDGFLPSNYPESFLGSYGDASFVSSDLSSTAWLTQCGRVCLNGRGIIQPKVFSRPRTGVAVRSVCLLLGHGGDWAALINRSDTDLLVEAFLELSLRFPQYSYIIRPHPGTEHPRHEGIGALVRIKDLCAKFYPAVEFSCKSLQEDLDRGDIFLSEYSATLVDAWASGKLGVAVNLTRRRSLMADFSSYGFPECSSLDELVKFFESVSSSQADLIAAQAAAVEVYNAHLSRLMQADSS